MNKILIVIGTRPEAIKFAPLIKELEKNPNDFQVKICVSGQHKSMLDQVLDFFDIMINFNLKLMKKNQTLFDVTSGVLLGLKSVIDEYDPDIMFVQGDTTTALSAALSGFYKKVTVAHIEAGLRTNDKQLPYPEEMNRMLIGDLSNYHFAPTVKAKENLFREGIESNVWVVGNTVIDAMFLTIEAIKEKGEDSFYDYFDFLDFSKKQILVTCHRRESFGEVFENICLAIKEIANKYRNVQIVYPVHLNPNVKRPAYKILGDVPNVFLIEPLAYPYFTWLMNKAFLVLTDSGGIQEEAPSLGKPVLVMRNVTERSEGIDAGTAKLVGTCKSKIVEEVTLLFDDIKRYDSMAKAVNPYGDGNSCLKIVEILKNEA